MKKATRVRVRSIWQHVWTKEIEKWTAWKIKENMWRFDKVDEFDDVMQEAQMLFYKLCKKYPLVNNANFFGLYKTSLSRMFIDKTRIKQRLPTDQNVDIEDPTIENQLEGNLPNYGHLNLLIEEMPDELKIVLQALTSGRVRFKLDRPTKSKRMRENHNMRLKRRFSLTSVDPVGDLRNYLLNT